MTEKELFRYSTFQQVYNKQIFQVKAGGLLKISDRQVRNFKQQMP